MMTPTQVEPFSPTEIRIGWNNGKNFVLDYSELRFQCPCASCVDEMTGKRTLKKEQIQPGIKPKEVAIVGRYALQFRWNDGHSTGIYHFDTLSLICEKMGRLLDAQNA